jgi:ABC-type uncharacterized transport system fused permease/ATPase subunit
MPGMRVRWQVSVDVEGLMYRHCRKLNITLLTVSHRKSLWQFHEVCARAETRPRQAYVLHDNKHVCCTSIGLRKSQQCRAAGAQ